MRHRIAFCITELRAGGAERCLVELATRLDQSQFECSVTSLAPEPAESQRSLVPRLRATGIPVHFLAATSVLDAWRVVRNLSQVWKQERPDLVQSFLYHANIAARLAARRAGVPLVVSGIRVAEQRSWLRLCLDRRTAGNVARHVCVSEAVARFSIHIGRLPADRMTVIPNGIDALSYRDAMPASRASLGVSPERRLVVCIGRLDRQKGQRWLLEHAPSWLHRLPDHDLILVGDGPDHDRLVALADSLGVSGRVRFAGWRNDVASILKAADMLVLPSAWEGMPNVILEAMAARRPVVARGVEGVEELLGPLAASQVVPVRDAQSFMERIVAFGSDAELRSATGRQNQSRVEAEFTLGTMVERYEQLYLTLLNNSLSAK